VLQTLNSPDIEETGHFGKAVSGTGDTNGDGTADLLIGAPREEAEGERRAGRAYLFGGARGWLLQTLKSPNAENDGRFGRAISGVRDANGDGTADLLIGAPEESAVGEGESGRAYLFSGATGEVLQALNSPNAEDDGHFGKAVAGAGDANGDGTADLLIGAPEEEVRGEREAGQAYRVPTGNVEAILARRKKKIQESLTQDTLSIQKVGSYNVSQKVFPITIQDETYEVEIPPREARSFDENWQDTRVIAYRQLTEDLRGYRYFNRKVIHPITGNLYPVGPQEEVKRPTVVQKQLDPDQLPETTASVDFTEPSGNDRLDGGEEATLTVTVENTGQGPARKVRAQTSPVNRSYVTYPASVRIGTIPAGSSVSESFQIGADRKVSSGEMDLTLRFEEANGFAPSPVRLQFETREFIPPELTVADVGIDDASGNGVIDAGELVEVTTRVKNDSRGRAEGVSAKVNFGENVLATTETRQSFDLGKLGPGEHQDIQFSLLTNQQAESVPVTVDLTEKYGEYGTQDIKLPLDFNQPTNQITEVQVEGQDEEVAVQKAGQLSVDVEANIPTTEMDRPDAVAVVVGIRSYSAEGAPDVEYARRDARVMRKYLTQTLGFREENILPRDPDGRMTYAELRTLIQQKLPSYVKEGTSEVFVYYSGHGAPSTGEEKRAYIVPSDTDPNFVSEANAYQMERFYEDLARLDARSLTVALDACFTGQSGSGDMMLRQASPLALSVENPIMAAENATGFLAAGPKQLANWYPEKKHGMFTYFFLKGLKGGADLNADQAVTVREMKQYLTDEQEGLPYWSSRVHQREQVPQVVSQTPSRVLVQLP
jgi:hypothetical protein